MCGFAFLVLANWIDRIIIFLINCELFPSDIALEKSKINENFD